MELLDLLVFALFIWVFLRMFRGTATEAPRQAEERARAEREPLAGEGAGGEREPSPPPDRTPERRDPLMEMLRGWEAEQRRRAGEQPVRPEAERRRELAEARRRAPEERARALEEWSGDREGVSPEELPAEAVSLEEVAGEGLSLEEPSPVHVPGRRPPRRPRRRAEIYEEALGPEVGGEETAAIRPRAAPAPRRRGRTALALLEARPLLHRAILYGEILGPPRAARGSRRRVPVEEAGPPAPPGGTGAASPGGTGAAPPGAAR